MQNSNTLQKHSTTTACAAQHSTAQPQPAQRSTAQRTRVVQHHRVCGGQVDAQAARPGGKQEKKVAGGLAVERVDATLPLGGACGRAGRQWTQLRKRGWDCRRPEDHYKHTYTRTPLAACACASLTHAAVQAEVGVTPGGAVPLQYICTAQHSTARQGGTPLQFRRWCWGVAREQQGTSRAMHGALSQPPPRPPHTCAGRRRHAEGCREPQAHPQAPTQHEEELAVDQHAVPRLQLLHGRRGKRRGRRVRLGVSHGGYVRQEAQAGPLADGEGRLAMSGGASACEWSTVLLSPAACGRADRVCQTR